jgi:putative membrane protein
MTLNRMHALVSLSCSCLLMAALMAAATAALAQDPAAASEADKHFVREALMGGMAEVELGHVASQKGSSADVKRFGQKMVEDHSRMGGAMKEVATQIGVMAPTELAPEDQALKAKLEALSGAEFDRAYIRAMVKDHQDDLEAFKAEAANGSSPAVKDAASQGAKVVSEHLNLIEQIAASHHMSVNGQGMSGKSGR